MKQLNIILPLLLVLCAACEKEQDMAKAAPIDQVAAPVLAPHDAIVVTKTSGTTTVTFRWQSETDFGIPTEIEYSLYVQIGDGARTLVASSYDDSVSVKLKDVNNRIVEAGAEYDVPVNVDFILAASVNENYAVYAQPVVINVTPTFLYPEKLYMIGGDFGNWKWDGAGVVEMTPVNGDEYDGHFWCVRYFTSGQGFKWCPVKEWKDDFFNLDKDKDVGFTVKDGNAFVSADGFYSVYIDYAANTITIEPAQVFGMGDCFGGWNAGQYPFTVAGKVMTIKTTAAGELRMYAASSATGADWWRMEFIILNGKIVYRGKGKDQERVKVEAGKTVTLDFNAGAGTIK
jgi:hypothetical protein